MGIEKQGAKPYGSVGILFGKLMNRFHTGLYRKYFSDRMPDNNSEIIDLGCGGGKFLSFLNQKNNSYKLYGIDHSPEMISLAEKVNSEAIDSGKMAFFNSSVDSLDFENDSIDLFTAMETIQFWPDIKKAASEINRVLKQNGRFLIINRYPKEGTKWWKLAKIKNEEEYKKLFLQEGFSSVLTNLKFKKGWIVVEALK